LKKHFFGFQNVFKVSQTGKTNGFGGMLLIRA